MEPVSSKFLTELRKSHRVFSYVDVVGNNNKTIRLKATEGDVSVDRTADVRRRCSATLVDPTGGMTPTEAGDVLTPYGSVILPYRGIMYTDGSIEVLPLGVFRISASSVKDEVGKLSISLEGYDYSRTIARDKFTAPYTVAKGTNIITAIQNIAKRTFTDLDFDAVTTYRTVPNALVYDTDANPWETCQELATSAGCEVYFDVRGRLVIAPVPDVDDLGEADYSYVEGDSCTLIDLERSFSDEEAYNGVVVVGESPDDSTPPVRALVWDEDPKSVTYHKGPYGEAPIVIQDSTVKTTADATLVATAQLKNLLGVVAKLGVTVLPNPAFEAGDIIKVKRSQSGVDDKFVVDGFNIPLAASGTQDLTLRQKRTVS